MAIDQRYNWSIKNKEFISGIKDEKNLPTNDISKFSSGFLEDNFIDDKPLSEIDYKYYNHIAKYRSSWYYLGENILEDYEVKQDKPFTMMDPSGYYITLSGPGHLNTDNHSRFELNNADGKWWKPAIKDLLTIKPDFTWERSKEVDTDFYVKWMGNYRYTSGYVNYNSGLIVLSLSGQFYSGMFSGENIDNITNYGLIFGPIDNIHIYKEFIYKRISGIVTNTKTLDFSGEVFEDISGVIKGEGHSVIQVELSDKVSGEVDTNILETISGESFLRNASGFASEIVQGQTAYGDASNTFVSGFLDNTYHNILSKEYYIGYGLAKEIVVRTEAFAHCAPGEFDAMADEKVIYQYFDKTIENVVLSKNISGTGSGILSALAIETVEVPIKGVISTIENNILVSGEVSGDYYGTTLYGFGSGYANNVEFSTEKSGKVQAELKGYISEYVTGVKVNGDVQFTVPSLKGFTGTISGNITNNEFLHRDYTWLRNCILEETVREKVSGEIPSYNILTKSFIQTTLKPKFNTIFANNKCHTDISFTTTSTGLNNGPYGCTEHGTTYLTSAKYSWLGTTYDSTKTSQYNPVTDHYCYYYIYGEQQCGKPLEYLRGPANLTGERDFVTDEDAKYFGTASKEDVAEKIANIATRYLDYNAFYSFLAPVYTSTYNISNFVSKVLIETSMEFGHYISGDFWVRDLEGRLSFNSQNNSTGSGNAFLNNGYVSLREMEANVKNPHVSGTGSGTINNANTAATTHKHGHTLSTDEKGGHTHTTKSGEGGHTHSTNSGEGGHTHAISSSGSHSHTGGSHAADGGGSHSHSNQGSHEHTASNTNVTHHTHTTKSGEGGHTHSTDNKGAHSHSVNVGSISDETAHTHGVGGIGITVSTIDANLDDTAIDFTKGYGIIENHDPNYKTSFTKANFIVNDIWFNEAKIIQTEAWHKGPSLTDLIEKFNLEIKLLLQYYLSRLQYVGYIYDRTGKYILETKISGLVSGVINVQDVLVKRTLWDGRVYGAINYGDIGTKTLPEPAAVTAAIHYPDGFPVLVSGGAFGKLTVNLNENKVDIKGVTYADARGTISGLVINKISGILSGTATADASAIVYCVGSGMPEFDDKIILSTNIDDSFSDMTNFYNISGLNGELVLDNDLINPGGRGELIQYITPNIQKGSEIDYSIGSFTNNLNSSITDNNLEIIANKGIEKEYTTKNDHYFGMDGGNIIQDSFDFYEKHEPKNGFIKIIYGYNYFNTLKITINGEIDILKDYSDSLNNKKVISNYEVELYYRIKNRDLDLDLENSILNGEKLKSENNYYTLIYDKPEQILPDMTNAEIDALLKRKYENNEIYIEELDNQRRKMTFKIPDRSVNNDNNIDLYLQTSKRKFYFAIAQDANIDKIEIGPSTDKKIYYVEDQEKDGTYRKHKKRNIETDIIELDENGNPIYEEDYYGLLSSDVTYVNGNIDPEYSSSEYEIRITFKNENDSLMKEVITNYLHDCILKKKENVDELHPNEISESIHKSNNFVQAINPFYMPKRDVLLFLKTEKLYTLTIYVEKGEEYIIGVNHEDDTIRKETYNSANEYYEVPIIAKHFVDDKIIIHALFNEESDFMSLDKEYIYEQLIDISPADFRYNENEKTYEPYKGYDPNIHQKVKFLMPARDVTLYLKSKDYRRTLSLLREINTDNFTNVLIKGIHYENGDEISDSLIGQFLEKETIDVVTNEKLWFNVKFLAGDLVTITVLFISELHDGSQKYFYRIDDDYLKSQLSSIGIEERIYSEPLNKYLGFEGKYQSFSFTMPDEDTRLIIKEESIIHNLTLKPEQYQYNDEYFMPRRIVGFFFKDNFYNFTTHEGVTLRVVDYETNYIILKFADIYQHLDNDYMISQDPSLAIVEAGEDYNTSNGYYNKIYLDDTFRWPENTGIINGTAVSADVKQQNKNKQEYLQICIFKMPPQDFTLVFSWVERLFIFNIDCMTTLFESNTIYESNRTTRIIDPPEIIRQNSLPHGFYPNIIDEHENVVSTKFRIISQFANKMLAIKVKDIGGWNGMSLQDATLGYRKSCYFNIENIDKIFALVDMNDNGIKEDPSRSTYADISHSIAVNAPINFDIQYVREDKEEPWSGQVAKKNIRDRLMLSFNVKKLNLLVTLNIGLNINDSFKSVGYMIGSFVLDSGRYTLSFCGAKGGVGGDAPSGKNRGMGSSGKGFGSYTMIVERTTTMNYILGGPGSAGGGGSGNAGGAGGGGGGASALYFSNEVKINGQTFEAIYCEGGAGGKGAKNGQKLGKDGGNGGYAGTIARNGNGGDGGQGGDSMFQTSSAIPGAGGLGYNYTNLASQLSREDNSLILVPTTDAPAAVYTAAGGDARGGIILLVYNEEYSNTL